MTGCLFALQVLTNLGLSAPGPGLPGGWRLQRMRGAEPPDFQVTRAHDLRIETKGQAGFASYHLRAPLRPAKGELTWRWRTDTPLRDAALHQRARDDSPVRVFVVFDDGRMLYYTWGNAEGRGETFASWTGASRVVIVLERAEDADGSWHLERRDPFADYRRAWNRAPHPIVAVGVSADTDMLHGRSAAEVGELTWEPGGQP